jgi:hypothetical protein
MRSNSLRGTVEPVSRQLFIDSVFISHFVIDNRRSVQIFKSSSIPQHTLVQFSVFSFFVQVHSVFLYLLETQHSIAFTQSNSKLINIISKLQRNTFLIGQRIFVRL